MHFKNACLNCLSARSSVLTEVRICSV